MEKMSVLPQKLDLGDVSKEFFPAHYEGRKIIQEFPDITKGAKKVRSLW